MKSLEENPASDFSVVLSLLSSIAPTFTKVEHVNQDAIDFTQTVNAFIFSDESGINTKIKSLPAAQIKDLNETDIIAVVKAYYDLSGNTMGKEAFCLKTQLDLLIIFLHSPYLDKKLTALNEIKKLFDKRAKTKDVPSKTLAKWLSDCNIIDYIYKEAKHPELISRSADLLCILSLNDKLEPETLELLWETAIHEHKHEAVAEATLNVIATIARHLNADMISIFIDRIHNLPLPTLGEYVGIFKDFYFNCINAFKAIYGKSQAEKKLSKMIDLGKLWEAIQDEAELSNRNKDVALDALIDLMDAFDLSNTSEFLQKAIENLKVGASPIRCMVMVEKVLEKCTRRGYPSVFRKEDLIMLAINSAEIYLNKARENSPMDGRNIEDMTFSGSLSHKDTIAKYFSFISYLLKSFDAHNKLTSEHIDMMFKVFVKESISQVERSRFYKFFTYDEFDTANQDDKKVASAKVREYLFQNILCKELNSENTGICEFKCFETNFFFVNTAKRNLKRELNERVFRTISMKMDGLDLVWDFSIFSKDDSIRKKCNDFLADLYLYYEKEDYIKRGKNNLTFFEEWLEKILTIDENDKQSIANILRLLFNFVNRYDGHHMDNEHFDKLDVELEVDMVDPPKDQKKKKLFKVNKDMTIGAIRKKIGDSYGVIPSEILILSANTYLSECCMNDKLSAYKECRNINVRRRTKEEREKELPRFLAAANLNVVEQVINKGLESTSHALR